MLLMIRSSYCFKNFFNGLIIKSVIYKTATIAIKITIRDTLAISTTWLHHRYSFCQNKATKITLLVSNLWTIQNLCSQVLSLKHRSKKVSNSSMSDFSPPINLWTSLCFQTWIASLWTIQHSLTRASSHQHPQIKPTLKVKVIIYKYNLMYFIAA